MSVPDKKMASTRYGRIYHSQSHHNNMKFPSSAARDTFAAEFKKYHDSHEHDCEVPRFEMIKAADVKSYERDAHDYDQVTMDGYEWYEIKKYHNREFPDTHTHYRVPTCCLSPIIVLDREFIDSGTLQRHELSSIFGDMPDDDFANLMKSVKADGFMDFVIRMHEDKILDGWHRYRAALALNLVRKLMFYSWDEEKEGTAVAFVAARNIERRHLSAGQRAQIVVSLNERFGWGGDRSKEPNDPLKMQDALAQQANVSKKSIQRAVKVEKAAESEAVIAGEKSATQVIDAREKNKLLKQKKKTCKMIWDTRGDAATIYVGEGETDLNKWLTLPQLEKGFAKNNPIYAEAFEAAMQRTSVFSFKILIDKVLESEIDIKVLEKEYRALLCYVGDLRQWQREDWSPDTNWILPLIHQKKDAASKPEPKPEPESEPEPDDDLKTLWGKVTAQMPKWKQKYKESGYREEDLVSRASQSMLITALRVYRKSEASNAATVDELKDLLSLLKSQSYPFARSVRRVIGETEPAAPEGTAEAEQTDAETAETPETCPDDETDTEASDADTSLAALNLPSLEGILDAVLGTVGVIEDSFTRDDLSVSIYEVFEQFADITEREQLSILIDCALSLVTETEANA